MLLFQTITVSKIVILARTKQPTLASKACLKISQRVLANRSDFPVSVANKMVHLTLRANARPISFAENLTALKMIKLNSYFLKLIFIVYLIADSYIVIIIHTINLYLFLLLYLQYYTTSRKNFNKFSQFIEAYLNNFDMK